MSRKGAGAQKEESKGSGLLGSLLLAGGAAAVGFLASELFTDWKQQSAGPTSSGARGLGPRGLGPSSTWGNNETWGSNSTARKDNRTTAQDKDTPNGVKCVVCMENPREIILIPCGHVCLCEDCSEKVPRDCPICRIRIQDRKSAYLS